MNEEPYKLPAGWTWATVQDVVLDSQSGFESGKKNVKGGINHLRMNNISEACTLDLSSVITVPKDLARPAHILKPGDVLFCHTNIARLVGKTALFDRADGPYAFSNHLTRLRVPADGPPPEWLWFWLAALWRRRYFETRCKQWVNQATVERGTLLSARIPVAPLHEQRRIVAHIRKIIERNRLARDRLRRLPEIIRKFRQSVLAKAFRGELTERDQNNEPAEKLLERIKQERRKKWEEEIRAKGKDPSKHAYEEPRIPKEEELCALPSGWTWARLGIIADILQGQHIMSKDYGTKPEGFPYMTGPADFGPVYPVVTKWTHKPKIMATPGCVLVTVKGSGVGKVNILANQKVAIGRQLMALTPADLVDPKYLFYFLTLALRTMQESSSGTTVPGLAKNDISEIPISIAPYGEQRRLVQKVESLLEQADYVEKAIDAARKCAQSLEEATLSRAFRGELVPQDPNDEPASAILERIRAQRGMMGRKAICRKLGEFASPAAITPNRPCEGS